MRLTFPVISLIFAATALADEAAIHRFDSHGAHQQEGFPEHAPKIFAIAEKTVTLHFSGLPADWQPVVHIHRTTVSRRIALPSTEVETAGDAWQLSWTPPETRGPAQYEIRLEGDPNRVVRIESRDPAWILATREALDIAGWEAQGLTAGERTALEELGIRTGRAASRDKQASARLEMRPCQDGTARRRVVWDGENPYFVVWRHDPATGDLGVRAPRWWISPEALATDNGLIRFLDLFSEPPPNP